ncbi:family 16 glycosylhydrolase [Clostridium sp. D53t1_180928_C8]|uniref:family 16 glycosylhydrolase n=1 Tax=Clostridium sp. D53t1_180928_C8 TaxID=2787101 RepID=UPI00325FB2AA
MVWADDFNESQLDSSKWEYELGSIRGIEQQHYVNDEENVFLRDNQEGGELVLKATDRPKELQYNNPRNDSRRVIYNSGSVRTHGKSEFLYGRIEMKAKLPKGQSVFPAFWTLGSDFTIDGDINSEQGYGWARCGEIDIMELIGSDEGGYGNKTVYQTIHTQDGGEEGYHKLGGTAYTILEQFNDEYHIFGMDWSKGKIEWYVDDKIVASVDYSNDPIASKCLDRPQYIQMNLAMGGAWPGEIAEGLAGTEYTIDYVYYGQNEQQKADAEEYYKNSPKIEECNDVSIYEGDTDVLSNVVVSDNADIDFSITDAPKFASKEDNAGAEEGLTSVDLICNGKTDLSRLAKLPAGEYSLYYTALPKDLKVEEMSNGVKIPNTTELYKFDRKGVNLTIKERSLETDLENSGLSLDGYINEKLETIVLPEGWTWENPETIITEDMEEVTVLFSKNGFEKTEKVSINALVKGEETPDTPEKPETPDTPEKPEGSKPETSKPDKGNNGLVQTGDMSSLGATAAMLMASGATILVTRKRKEKK